MKTGKVRFGVLSTAKIGVQKVIPAMQMGENCEVTAIASRDKTRARQAADELHIPKACESYEELLADDAIDAVYIPLPNHMHVPWSIKSLEAGKHVLCEKPIGLSEDEALELIEAAGKYPDLKIMEAFMYRHHPRWQKAKELVDNGTIGTLKVIHSFFSYFNDDPNNIRNKAGIGGGSLMDIGCYSVSLSRFLFGEEPCEVKSVIETDPDFNTDRLVSSILEFNNGRSLFTSATQCHKHQYVKIFGTKGKIEMEWPFNPETDEPTILHLETGDSTRTITFEPCNHFTIQGDLFARAILENRKVPVPLEDAAANMAVIGRLINR